MIAEKTLYMWKQEAEAGRGNSQASDIKIIGLVDEVTNLRIKLDAAAQKIGQQAETIFDQAQTIMALKHSLGMVEP